MTNIGREHVLSNKETEQYCNSLPLSSLFVYYADDSHNNSCDNPCEDDALEISLGRGVADHVFTPFRIEGCRKVPDSTLFNPLQSNQLHRNTITSHLYFVAVATD